VSEQQTVRQLQILTGYQQDTNRILTLSPDTSEFNYPVMQLHGCKNIKSLNKVFVSCDKFMETEGKYSHHFL